MKCRCGNIVSRWYAEFGGILCDDCRFIEYIKKNITIIEKVIKDEPTAKLSKLTKIYIDRAKDEGILTKENNFLINHVT